MSEAERQRELDTYRIVDSLPDAAFDDLVRIAASVCDAPIAALTLIDRDRQCFKSRIGIEDVETSRKTAFCDHAIRVPQALMEVEDAARDARFATHPDVTGGMGIRFYAGMPLVTPHGAAVGTVCVVDHAPRALDAPQRDALSALARVAMNLMELRRQLLDAERTTALHAAADSDGCYSIAIVELQRHAEMVRQRGHALVEHALRQCGNGLDRLLASGESLSRVGGAAEFVLTLNGEVDASRLAAIERIGMTAAMTIGAEVVVASAASASPTESPLSVFERADEALSRRKDLRAMPGYSASGDVRAMRH